MNWKWIGMSSLFLAVWSIPVRAQCILPAEFYPALSEWSDTREVSDFIDMVGPSPWWELVISSVPQPILDNPAQTDMGQAAQDSDFLFTIRHTANACVDTSVSGSPSRGVLTIDSTNPVGYHTEEVLYRYTPTTPGEVTFAFSFFDDTDAALHEATLKLTVLATYTLTVNRGTGVLGNPAATDDYLENTSVNYAYSSATCYENLGVTLDGAPVSASGSVLMDDDHALISTADFIVYQIDVGSTAGGSTNREGTNYVDCGSDFTITAIPDSCYDFAFWSGDASGSANPLVLNNVSESQSITANFVQQEYTVTVSSTTGGHTDHDGPNTVACGDNFTVEAIPDTGYEFTGWTGDLVSSDNPLTIQNVTQNFSITANFGALSTIDMFVSRVEVIQGTTMNPIYRVHIADRPSVVRVFVGISGTPSISGVLGRLTRYVGGSPQDSITVGPITAVSSPYEGDLNDTLNFQLPANWLNAGTAYVLDLDPNNTIAESNEGNNRHPAVGTQNFDFRVVDDLDIMIVPIRYTNALGQTATPTTSPFPPAYLTWFPPKVYPISTINYQLHAEHPFTGNLKLYAGWSELLDEITAIHNAEDPGRTKEYYGLVNFYTVDGCAGGCYTGLGWIGQPTAIGYSGFGPGTNEASETMTHEIGHNFARYHAPCGGAGNPDPAFPYTGGRIGMWGLDVATMTLKNPNGNYDFMGYCDPNWTSDYTYKAIYDWRETHSWKTKRSGEFRDALYFGGHISPEGTVRLLPAYRHNSPIDPTHTGSHRLVLRDENGTLLASHHFTPTLIADGDGSVGFSLRVPYHGGVTELEIYEGQNPLFHRLAEGPAPHVGDISSESDDMGSLDLTWNASENLPNLVYRLRYSPDGGQNWTVLAVRQVENAVHVSAELLAQATDPILEIQAVDGVRMATKSVRLK